MPSKTRISSAPTRLLKAATPVNVIFLVLSAFVLWGYRAQPVRLR